MVNSYDLLALHFLEDVLDSLNSKEWEKEFIDSLSANDISPRQRWFLYNACIKFRRYIDNRDLLDYCWEFVMDNRTPPNSRRQAESILREVKVKAKKDLKEKKARKVKSKKPVSEYMDIGDFQEQHNMWADTFKEEVKKRDVASSGHDQYLISGLKEVAQLFITGELHYFKNK